IGLRVEVLMNSARRRYWLVPGVAFFHGGGAAIIGRLLFLVPCRLRLRLRATARARLNRRWRSYPLGPSLGVGVPLRAMVAETWLLGVMASSARYERE